MTTTGGTFARLLDPAVRADPYPVFEQIRRNGAVRIGEAPVVVLAGYAECAALLRDPGAGVERRHATIPMGATPTHDLAGPHAIELRDTVSFLFRDPPDHTRLRRLVSKAFTPSVIRRLGPRITAIVDAALDRAAARGGFDLVADLAYPLPVTVICELLGVPLSDEPRLRAWSSLLARSLDPVSSSAPEFRPDAEELVRANNELYDYFDELTSTRRAAPGDDLLSGLIAAEDSGDLLTHNELIATCGLLLMAGHETTVNLIANGGLALLRHPEHLETLRTEPHFGAQVVEETLRYDPPVQLIPRIVYQDIRIGELELRPGDLAIMLLAAAHRDPSVFPQPARFDPYRENKHLAFGLGPHFCLGASLARLEADIALTRFAQRVIGPRLTCDPPEYRAHVNLRGPAAMPLAYTKILPAE
ncbi:cytochrome P450 [Nocardia sp. NPDC020380]|uniref:cytochrome P450 n=1 Tax=Nocardia sp. NPDC020380 TaxID=3364309 RepID=UPI0037AD5BC2